MNDANRKREYGHTLVELVVVMAIFSVILIITSQAFDRVATSSGRQIKAAETQTAGIFGLELFRMDISMAGAGLPWGFYDNSLQEQKTPSYKEAEDGADFPVAGINAKTFNDAPANPPRAVWSANNKGLNGSDYLVIRSTTVGMSEAAQKFATMDTGGAINATTGGFAASERVIVIRPVFSLNGGIQDRQLVMDSNGKFSVTFPTFSGFLPNKPMESYLVNGVDSGGDLRMPFNRADFYLRRPSTVPQSCAPGTGVLYKNPVSQQTGIMDAAGEVPLLDCVADMQVIYTLGSDLHLDDPAAIPNSGDLAKGIRDNVRELRVYILAQEGPKDRDFTFPTSPAGEIYIGEFGKGRSFRFGDYGITDWQHYRWRMYTLVVPLKNLQ